ncbi:isocyanide synthase family protein [Allokutzneria sp. A3M-2-11 16]|uniref:L-tyrosine/L-tryptophan isonitrile synthase family protein n=1 Tax=Allokutzneria sp. A3M-2-11 16 TaxID=2962043 RepID=UPI0020B6995F|nr:L-tyrosine/L-tryptophan isonitrile synthase family protein [Allokutzneria sp. A3M-2-11 16]MCP3801966.1 isocyanide synthase family protein [Allokutzneria sp. A3M-2-11 16]
MPTSINIQSAAARVLDRDGNIDPWFVMLSPNITHKRSAPAFPPRRPDDSATTCTIQYRELSEQALSNAEKFVKDLWGELRALASTEERVFRIMASGRYRSGTLIKSKFDKNWQEWLPLLRDTVSSDRSISFALPSFPFKIPNQIKVRRRSPDMAELLCLQRLLEICHAISLVHEPGASFNIISDGIIYSDICGVSRIEATSYFEQIGDMIAQLHATERIKLFDMREDILASCAADYEEVRTFLEPKLREWWSAHDKDDQTLHLVRTFATNIDLRPQINAGLSYALSYLGSSQPLDATTQINQLLTEIEDQATSAAFEFALTLCALKSIDAVATFFPHDLRATVHPKPGQWGIHLVNNKTRVFPWQGVAFKKKSGEWRVHTEAEAIRRRAVPVHLQADPLPYYYQATSDS